MQQSFCVMPNFIDLELEQVGFLLVSYLPIGSYNCLRILPYLKNERKTSFSYWNLFSRIVSIWRIWKICCDLFTVFPYMWRSD